MGDTAIEWTDKTWNPVVGCTKVSPGCKNCYAKTLHDQRHKAFKAGHKMPAQYAHPFEVVQLMPDRLDTPLGWRKPQRVFVNSVSDLFHADVPDEFLDRVFAVMALAGRHTFQVLTKRPERMAAYLDKNWMSNGGWTRCMVVAARCCEMNGESASEWPKYAHVHNRSWPLPNVWLGTSVETQAAADGRIPHLLRVPAAVRFLSCEPLLGPVSLRDVPGLNKLPGVHMAEGRGPAGIDWCIVGGESGPGARRCDVEWIRSLVGQCRAAGVACFVKQLGAAPFEDNATLRAGLRSEPRPGGGWTLTLLDKKGGDPDEWHPNIRVREFPTPPRA